MLPLEEFLVRVALFPTERLSAQVDNRRTVIGGCPTDLEVGSFGFVCHTSDCTASIDSRVAADRGSLFAYHPRQLIGRLHL